MVYNCLCVSRQMPAVHQGLGRWVVVSCFTSHLAGLMAVDIYVVSRYIGFINSI